MALTGDGLQALEKELGGAPPPGVASLDSDDLYDLARAVANARRRQAAEIGAAGDQALNHVPRLLRVAIRKVVG
jgi:hypothetical protein